MATSSWPISGNVCWLLITSPVIGSRNCTLGTLYPAIAEVTKERYPNKKKMETPTMALSISPLTNITNNFNILNKLGREYNREWKRR